MKKNLFKLICAVATLVGCITFVTENSDALSVTNRGPYSGRDISVSSWGKGGSKAIWGIDPGKTERWNRSDRDGVLLVHHKISGASHPMFHKDQTFYLSSTTNYYVSDGRLIYNGGNDITPIDTNVPYGTEKKIRVKNINASWVRVRISRWGDEGSAKTYTIPMGKTETWNRSDMRGYIMMINDYQAYYIKPGKDIEIKGLIPYIDGKRIPSIQQRTH